MKKIKEVKKIVVMLMCLVMVVSTLGACKKSVDKKQDNLDSKDDSTAVTEEEKELIKIDYSEPAEYTYWLYATPGDYNSDYNKNPVMEYFGKKFNMKISFQQPSSGTELDALNLMLGTGEYTDIIDTTYYTGSLTQLYEEDVIIDISKYLDYMPNLKGMLESNEGLRKNAYDDEGHMLKLPTVLSDEQLMWGGLVYRRDILETMTGKNINFPSGHESPTTIADWDYMLPLYQQYFKAAKMADYAPLILPAKGYFDSGDLLTSFGAAPAYYVDKGTVKYGPMQEGFYNYLAKMNEWYKKGYIYKDFASRTNDLFYMPNTALTYGGAAGVWFGLGSQVGDLMSKPEYNLVVDVQAAANPIDTDREITTAPTYLYAGKDEIAGGVVITTSCENVERLLSSLDYLYSEEGGNLKGYGLTDEQGAGENDLYVKNGFPKGFYSVNEDGTFTFDSKTQLNGGTFPITDLVDMRLPGLRNNKYIVENTQENEKAASFTWLTYGTEGKLPASLYRTVDEESTYSSNQSNIDDYVNTMVVKFILGDTKLNKTTWEEFKKQLTSYGIEENITIQQAAVDRYQNR